jgi:BED zinc finger
MADINRCKSNTAQFFKATEANAAACNKCGKTVKRSMSNMSNLTVHLKYVHWEDQKTLHELCEQQKCEAEFTAQTQVRKQQTVRNIMERCKNNTLIINPKVQCMSCLLLGTYCHATIGC